MKKTSVFLVIPIFCVVLCAETTLPKFGVTAIKLKGALPAYSQTCVIYSGKKIRKNVQKGDVLYFSIAAKKQFNTASPVKFSIHVKSSSETVVLFSTSLNPENINDRGWQNRKVDLDQFAQQTVELSFSSGPFQLWGGVRWGDFKRKEDEYNLILLSLDTLRADHLGVGGYKTRGTSPHIDALAKESVYFDEAVAQSPWTEPSHMSMLTGLYPSQHGMFWNFQRPQGKMELSSTVVTFPMLLRRHGYLTQAYTGSDYVAANFGFYRGFDHYNEYTDKNHNDGSYVFEQASTWLKENQSKKFFLFIHTYEIHTPFKHDEFLKSAAHLSESEKAKAQYDGGIFFVDQFVGHLQQTLKELHLDRKTIVILVSDHGEELLERGYKIEHDHTLYDELLRIPMLFHAPGLITPRTIMNYQAQHIDIFPTIMDLLGIPNPSASSMPGHSLKSILLGGKYPDESYAISEAVNHGPERKSIRWVGRSGKAKLILIPDVLEKSGLPVLLTNEKKHDDYDAEWNKDGRKNKGQEFYRLDIDPRETKNISDESNPKFQDLNARLRKHIKAIPTYKPSNSKSHLDEQLKDNLRSLGY